MNQKTGSMKFDVALSTFNSKDKLKECLDSVLREVPVNKIIVVDGGSTDGTIEILKGYSQVELHVRPDLTLGQSRAFSFSKVTTEWFVQVDSDIVLRKGWFEAMLSDMDKGDVIEGGMVNHWEVENPPANAGYVERKKYLSRALFCNNLMRTEAVKGVKLDCLHLEDELTRRYAERRGYTWYKNCRLLADHYSNPVRYRGLKPPFLFMSYPKWVYSEKGKVDAMSGVTWRTLIKNVFFMIGGRIHLAITVFGNPVKESVAYFQGYSQERKKKKQCTD